LAFLVAGTSLNGSVVSVLGKPNDGPRCSSQCGVGGLGQGGESSGGAAQGGYNIGPSAMFDNTVRRNAGTEPSGLFELSGDTSGSATGHVHDDDFTGRLTGFFGDCTGHASRCESG
jgi:hypothetical protein